MEFFDSIKTVKSNWNPYLTWENKQKTDDLKRQVLHNKRNISKQELEQVAAKGKTIIDAISIMDENAMNKSEDVEMATEVALSAFSSIISTAGLGLTLLLTKSKQFNKLLNKFPNDNFLRLFMQFAPTFTLPLIAMPFAMTKATKLEKNAARIARYQTMEKDLKDYKNFVVYTPQQLAEAEQKNISADNTSKQKRRLSIQESISSIKSVIADNDNYKIWSKKVNEEFNAKNENLDNLIFSPQELEEAEKEQDLIQRTMRKIEMKSQEYLSNSEVACNMINIGGVVSGVVGGFLISGITKLLQKIHILSDTSNAINILKKASPIVTPILLEALISPYLTKLQKNAARVGRFKAKQDLLSNPYNFISYSKEEMNSVQINDNQQKKRKSFLGEIKSTVAFFINLVKESKEYNEYNKANKAKNIVKDIQITEEQKQSAKKLQNNLFMTFEKMDEMSQRYVADVENATDIGKEYVLSITTLLGETFYLMLMSKPSKVNEKFSTMLYKSLPLLSPLFVKFPMDIKANQLEKEAGKIGIMKSMEDLEDSRLYLNQN